MSPGCWFPLRGAAAAREVKRSIKDVLCAYLGHRGTVQQPALLPSSCLFITMPVLDIWGEIMSVNIETLDSDASANCLPTSTTPRSLLCSGALNIHEYGSALPLLQLAVSSCRQDAGMVSAVVGERNLQGLQLEEDQPAANLWSGNQEIRAATLGRKRGGGRRRKKGQKQKYTNKKSTESFWLEVTFKISKSNHFPCTAGSLNHVLHPLQ